MKENAITVSIAIAMLLLVSLACSNVASNSPPESKPPGTANAAEPAPKVELPPARPAKLESYTIQRIKFAYYKVPAALRKDELVQIAQNLHDTEPDTQVIMVDDDSELADYISFVKAISGVGKLKKPLPKGWADEHVIANIQKNTNGTYVLCEGSGSIHIAELK